MSKARSLAICDARTLPSSCSTSWQSSSVVVLAATTSAETARCRAMLASCSVDILSVDRCGTESLRSMKLAATIDERRARRRGVVVPSLRPTTMSRPSMMCLSLRAGRGGGDDGRQRGAEGQRGRRFDGMRAHRSLELSSEGSSLRTWVALSCASGTSSASDSTVRRMRNQLASGSGLRSGRPPGWLCAVHQTTGTAPAYLNGGNGTT